MKLRYAAVPALLAVGALTAGPAQAAPSDDLLLLATDFPYGYTLSTEVSSGAEPEVVEDLTDCGEVAYVGEANFVDPAIEYTQLSAGNWLSGDDVAYLDVYEVLVETSGAPTELADILGGACLTADDGTIIEQTALGSASAVKVAGDYTNTLLAWTQVGSIQVRFAFESWDDAPVDEVWAAALVDTAVAKVAAGTGNA